MRYIITESQYKLIMEENIPSSIRRRTDKETLDHYINLGIMNYPTLCDDFDNPHAYVNDVVDYAIFELIYDINDEMENKDYFYRVLNYLREVFLNLYEDKLIEDYNFTCIENK